LHISKVHFQVSANASEHFQLIIDDLDSFVHFSLSLEERTFKFESIYGYELKLQLHKGTYSNGPAPRSLFRIVELVSSQEILNATDYFIVNKRIGASLTGEKGKFL
jgi:hypothetical protein